MTKFIGAIFLIGAAAGWGNEQARLVRKRLKALYQCKELVTLLQGQIRYAGSDLEECFRDIGCRLSGDFQTFCLCLARAIEGLPGRPFEAVWRAAAAECMESSGMTKDDLELFGTVGRALGYLDGESQCRHLEHYLEQLAPEIARAEEETGQKTRLYRSLGVCGGLFLTLLLL